MWRRNLFHKLSIEKSVFSLWNHCFHIYLEVSRNLNWRKLWLWSHRPFGLALDTSVRLVQMATSIWRTGVIPKKLFLGRCAPKMPTLPREAFLGYHSSHLGQTETGGKGVPPQMTIHHWDSCFWPQATWRVEGGHSPQTFFGQSFLQQLWSTLPVTIWPQPILAWWLKKMNENDKEIILPSLEKVHFYCF